MTTPRVFQVTQTAGTDDRPFQVVLKPARGMTAMFYCHHCRRGIVNAKLAYKNPRGHEPVACLLCGEPASCCFVDDNRDHHVTHVL